mmetsp:Transcript_4662/g.10884  ORF Transcript_4662/g.10884 Transcript_4662/m.10884 type:complete len:236 (-) Transcript_4662:662-1369(-)
MFVLGGIHLHDGYAFVLPVMKCELFVRRGKRLAMPTPRGIELNKDVFLRLQDELLESLACNCDNRILLSCELASLPALHEGLNLLLALLLASSLLRKPEDLVIVLRLAKLPQHDLREALLLHAHTPREADAEIIWSSMHPFQLGLVLCEAGGELVHIALDLLVTAEEDDETLARINVLKEELLCFLLCWDEFRNSASLEPLHERLIALLPTTLSLRSVAQDAVLELEVAEEKHQR